jgi:hypothetical protein
MSAFGRSWTAAIPIHSFNPGEYQVHALITLNNSQFHTRPTTFYITQPVYVTWTIDWEGYDAPDSYLDAMITIAEKYQLPMTHFFNPRIYTAPDIDPVRAEYLTQWVINRRDIYQEEIGLHLHMFKDFVESAGLEPKDEPNWSDGSGYDILTTAYSTDDLITLITHAKEWFDRYRLGIPRSYRAGGWFASSATLKALEATGFYADSSARTKYTFGSKNIPGFWDITPTTSPYFPSEFNQNSPDPEPRLSLLEIPNNGADTYAFSAQDMLDRFTANYSGGVSRGFTQVTFLSHPHWFNTDRQQKIRQVLDAVDQFSYQDDRGPVIYTTVSGVYQAWINQ